MQENNRANTIYDLIGGAEAIRKLVQAFYPKVQAHPHLGPLFPADITPVMEKQYMFLSQFFGGPPLYSEKVGPPMMRARHMPFPISVERAEEWLGCMKAAMEEIGLPSALCEAMIERLKGPAYHFVNRS